MKESKKKKKKKDGYDDILGLSYDKDMGKYASYITSYFLRKTNLLFRILFVYTFSHIASFFCIIICYQFAAWLILIFC